jgi:branched-chain amino acid transport system substrate-binding protein
VQQWNAADSQWVALTDYISPDKAVTDPLIAEDSAAYAAENGITAACL